MIFQSRTAKEPYFPVPYPAGCITLVRTGSRCEPATWEQFQKRMQRSTSLSTGIYSVVAKATGKPYSAPGKTIKPPKALELVFFLLSASCLHPKNHLSPGLGDLSFHGQEDPSPLRPSPTVNCSYSTTGNNTPVPSEQEHQPAGRE